MTHFDDKGDISVHLALFEKQISITVTENWVMYLLSLLLLEFANIVARKPDPEANDYDYVKKPATKAL